MRTINLILICLFCSVGGQAQNPDDNFFDFNTDVRLFTAYAFMNAAGNDAEWRKAGMHPIRIAVREELKGRLDSVSQKKIEDFNSSHGGSWTIYGGYALITNGPPDFHVSYDPQTTPYGKDNEESSKNLAELLAQFYSQANIAQLWQKYQPIIQSENDRFKPFAQSALNDIESYCRLKRGFFAQKSKRIHFQFSPLMLYFTAWTMNVNGELWIVAGPQEGQPDASTFYHEALHSVLGPLRERYSHQIDSLNELLPVAKSKASVGYESWPELVEECFVRTVDKILQAHLFASDSAKVHQMVEAEYKLGFILCFSIYESLLGYERQKLPLKEYYPAILKDVDVAKEKKRWERFWAEQTR
jgi:hypothetical protein